MNVDRILRFTEQERKTFDTIFFWLAKGFDIVKSAARFCTVKNGSHEEFPLDNYSFSNETFVQKQ